MFTWLNNTFIIIWAFLTSLFNFFYITNSFFFNLSFWCTICNTDQAYTYIFFSISSYIFILYYSFFLFFISFFKLLFLIFLLYAKLQITYILKEKNNCKLSSFLPYKFSLLALILFFFPVSQPFLASYF